MRAPCDRSGRSAGTEVEPGLTPDSIQPKYAQMVAPTWITLGCVQFLENKKRLHTAWTLSGHIAEDGIETNLQCVIVLLPWAIAPIPTAGDSPRAAAVH